MSDKLIQVSGKAFYACVHRPNELADAYTVDLVVDDATAATLEGLGLSAAKDREGNLKSHEGAEGKVFKFKRKVETNDGKELGPPIVVDAKNNKVTELIGNGSLVNLKAGLYTYTFRGKSGVGAGLKGVQVIDLVEYTSGKTSSLFSETEGFVSTPEELNIEDII